MYDRYSPAPPLPTPAEVEAERLAAAERVRVRRARRLLLGRVLVEATERADSSALYELADLSRYLWQHPGWASLDSERQP